MPNKKSPFWRPDFGQIWTRKSVEKPDFIEINEDFSVGFRVQRWPEDGMPKR